MSVTSRNKIPSLGLAVDALADTSMPSFPCHWGMGVLWTRAARFSKYRKPS